MDKENRADTILKQSEPPIKIKWAFLECLYEKFPDDNIIWSSWWFSSASDKFLSVIKVYLNK